MRKSYFLFLLLLLSVIGSVSATCPIIPESCTVTDYYVVLNDNSMNWELINASLSVIDYNYYTPVVSGVEGNIIYFSSKDDLARFLSKATYSTTSLPFNGGFVVYIEGQVVPVTVIDTYTYTTTGSTISTDIFLELSSSQMGYVFAQTSNGDYCSETITINGVQFFNVPYRENGGIFDSAVFTSSSIVQHSTISGGYDSRAARMRVNYVFFDYVGYSSNGSLPLTITEIYSPPERYDLTVTSNLDGITVYNGDIELGTANNGTVLKLVPGTYELTFVKEGYYNVTQTVEIVDLPVNVSVDMETTHTPVTLAITDSDGGLTGVNLYIDGVLTGTVGNNQDVSLPKGTHELIFEKAGYWNETRTVTVDETLTDLTIRMYPESVFFKISNTPSVITTYSNSEVNIALNIDPNDYAYGVKLYLTGQEVLDVRDSSNVQISKQDSYYLLDDFSSEKTVNVKINSGTTLGTNSLAVRVTGYNSIGTEFVTDTTIDYEILRLPLSLTVPNWCIGSNSLTVIETEGETRTVTIKIEDSESNIIYTDTYTLEGFETHKFNIDFDETGDYKLYIQSGDLINTYIDVNVANPVTLETKTITANEGSTATATVSIENPYTEPQYYRITIEGDPLTNATKVDFSISPGSSKSQSISFTLLDELDYDSYSLPLKVYLVEESGMTEIYSDSVILNIGSSGSFIPFIDFGDDGIIDTVITLVVDHPIILGIIIIGGLGVFIFSGKKKGKKPVKTIKKPIVKKGGKKGGK
ncbi:hypothetical protein HNP86_001074 [Methanococcus maripaludis]|uniref:PEGA domain-containing protein n=1 Tax=Methanococcus maripaludis TaxID=39152 RepID=A0A7J9NVD9_METMI|nr:PEGA domain-containing protein [Methanococcus maripaludis]MBA2850943.1 hypothetical protein [Methanococcus maripaludis]